MSNTICCNSKKSKKHIIAVLSFAAAAASFFCCLIISTSAYALTAQEVEELAGGSQYYDSGDEHWVKDGTTWEKCDVADSSAQSDALTDYIRRCMISRQKDITVYAALNKDVYGDKTLTNTNDALQKIFDTVTTNVYKTDTITDNYEAARSGDYLNMMTKSFAISEQSRRLTVSGSPQYAYFRLDFDITYLTTANMENQVDEFLTKWQKEFIEDNALINSCTTVNERNYYIVKTIYNFLSRNTLYDSAVYQYNITRDEGNITDIEKENQLGPGSGQFRNSHSAYGALFGNTYDAQGYVDGTNYDWGVSSDTTGLCKITNYNQGLAVCEGYTLVTYYLCRLNGIDCRIVTGDYAAAAAAGSDPHAWNLIKLCPSNSDVYSNASAQWYHFDATFAATSPTFVKLNVLTITDYSYFLRGSANAAFNAQNHQQLTDGSLLDVNDYALISDTVDCSNAWSVLTRRKDKDNYNEIESYFVISPDGKYYKISPETQELVEADNTISYDGNEYYYSLNVQDFAGGVEYDCTELIAKDAGNYSIKAYSPDGQTMLYELAFSITPLDMSDWSGYSSFVFQTSNGSKEIYNSDLSKLDISVEFMGGSVSFQIGVLDVAKRELTEGVEFALVYRDVNGNVVSPVVPGEYYVEINYDITNDNYAGSLFIPFKIVKGSFEQFTPQPLDALTYGTDVVSGCGSLRLEGTDIYLTLGTDYTVSLENTSALSYGDEGYVIYTALPSSEFLKEGTSIKRHYKIAYQRNLAETYNGMSTNMRYNYTGYAVTPKGFTIYDQREGNTYQLVENVDYVIAGYSNNVNPGTAYMTLRFTGNYCGEAVVSFEIVSPDTPSAPPSPSAQPSGSQPAASLPDVSVTVQEELLYTGKVQSPKTTVTSNGKALVLGKDYIVSELPAQVGVYEYKIQGIGEYSGFTAVRAVFITPAKISGLKNSTSSKKSVTLKWDGQGDNCFYEIYVYDTVKKEWTLMAITNQTSFTTKYTVKNNKKSYFKENMQCKFRIRGFYSVEINGTKYTKFGEYAQITAATKITAPSSPTLSKGKKSIKVKWKKAKSAAGYQIQYATDSKFKKNKKTVSVKGGKTTSATIKKLKTGKTYYVRVRAYQKVNGKKVYSEYTKTIKIKI